MNVKEIYAEHYDDYKDLVSNSCNRYEWAAGEVFELTTYDGELDELFVKKIIEVLKSIFEGKTFEYIENESNYITYIIVCQLLERFHWIEWGTSIRGAWFETWHPHVVAKPILDRNLVGMDNLPCTKENLIALIEFIEEG